MIPAEQRSTVLIIRAWIDDAGVRGRVMAESNDGEVRSTAAGSIEQLSALVSDALYSWAARA